MVMALMESLYGSNMASVMALDPPHMSTEEQNCITTYRSVLS